MQNASSTYRCAGAARVTYRSDRSGFSGFSGSPQLISPQLNEIFSAEEEEYIKSGALITLFDNRTGMQTKTTFKNEVSHGYGLGRPTLYFKNGSSLQIDRSRYVLNFDLKDQEKAPQKILDRYWIKVEFIADDQRSFKIPASSTVQYVDGTKSTWAELLNDVTTHRIAKPFEVNHIIYVVVQLENTLLQTSLKTVGNKERRIIYPSFGP